MSSHSFKGLQQLVGVVGLVIAGTQSVNAASVDYSFNSGGLYSTNQNFLSLVTGGATQVAVGNGWVAPSSNVAGSFSYNNQGAYHHSNAEGAKFYSSISDFDLDLNVSDSTVFTLDSLVGQVGLNNDYIPSGQAAVTDMTSVYISGFGQDLSAFDVGNFGLQYALIVWSGQGLLENDSLQGQLPAEIGRLVLGYGDGVSNVVLASQLQLVEVSQVPVPAAAWLFGSALLGMAGIKRKR